jgi:predicted nucleotidyltransferase
MPTALELTPAERARYIALGRRRAASAQVPDDPTIQREKEILLDRARLAAAELKARLGVRKVILFGSLAHGAWFTHDSDIDLAVNGLPKDSYWEAWRIIELFIPDRLIDLVELDTASPSLIQTIESDGIEL